MTKRIYVGLFAAVAMLIAGCSVSIKPGAEKITINKADPDPKCVEVGSVRGSSGMHDLDSCKNEMRNKALDLGANYIRWDSQTGVPGYTATVLNGTAFKCP